MRILIPYPSSTAIRGPLAKHTPVLVAALRALGCEVVTTPWGRRRDDESRLDKIVQRSRDVARIYGLLRRQSFDVMVVRTIHDRGALLRDLPLLLATRHRCRRLVLQFHGSDPDGLSAPRQWWYRWATWLEVCLCDAVLVLSTEEQRMWRRLFPFRPCFVVNNAFLPASTGPPVPPPPAWRLPDDKPVLLFVGRLVEAKGIFDLLRATPAILDGTPCHLLVAGDGPAMARVRRMVAELGLTAQVTLAGYLRGAELDAAYRAADTLVLPTFYIEGYPTVITEAMHAGLPIITTHIRGAADHLVEAENALFVPARDPAALARTVLRVLADPELRALMSAANREKVTMFAPEAVARQYLGVLDEIVGSRSG